MHRGDRAVFDTDEEQFVHELVDLDGRVGEEDRERLDDQDLRVHVPGILFDPP